MKAISLAEFNRHQTEVTESLAKDGEPIYLTRNGRSVAVLVDPDVYARQVGFKAEVERREMETYAGLLRGYQDVLDGKVVTAEEADERIRTKRGW